MEKLQGQEAYRLRVGQYRVVFTIGDTARIIEIIAIGFGGADNTFLRAIATTEKGSYYAKTGELVSTFGTIAQELMESGGDTAKRGSLRFF